MPSFIPKKKGRAFLIVPHPIPVVPLVVVAEDSQEIGIPDPPIEEEWIVLVVKGVRMIAEVAAVDHRVHPKAQEAVEARVKIGLRCWRLHPSSP